MGLKDPAAEYPPGAGFLACGPTCKQPDPRMVTVDDDPEPSPEDDLQRRLREDLRAIGPRKRLRLWDVSQLPRRTPIQAALDYLLGRRPPSTRSGEPIQ